MPTSFPYDGNYNRINLGSYDVTTHQFVAPQVIPNGLNTDNGVPNAPHAFVMVADPNTITASATASAAAQCQVTFAAVAGKTNYLNGFVVTSLAPGATVGGLVTVTGLVTGTLSYQFVETTSFGGELTVNFPQPVPASAANVAIVITLAAITSGAASAISAVGSQR